MKVVFSKDLEDDFLESIHEIDAKCYDSEYLDQDNSDLDRWYMNKDSYILVEIGGEYVGYINFFPMTNILQESVLFESSIIRDCDIRPYEIAEWGSNSVVYLMSIAILPEYRDGKVIKLLLDTFEDYLESKEVSSLVATTVSEDGEKVARYLGLDFIRTLENEDEKVWQGYFD